MNSDNVYPFIPDLVVQWLVPEFICVGIHTRFLFLFKTNVSLCSYTTFHLFNSWAFWLFLPWVIVTNTTTMSIDICWSTLSKRIRQTSEGKCPLYQPYSCPYIKGQKSHKGFTETAITKLNEKAIKENASSQKATPVWVLQKKLESNTEAQEMGLGNPCLDSGEWDAGMLVDCLCVQRRMPSHQESPHSKTCMTCLLLVPYVWVNVKTVAMSRVKTGNWFKCSYWNEVVSKEGMEVRQQDRSLHNGASSHLLSHGFPQCSPHWGRCRLQRPKSQERRADSKIAYNRLLE